MPLSFYRHKRPFHAYCIGLPKSGTHSIANIFHGISAHEPTWQDLIDIIAKEHVIRLRHNNENFFFGDKYKSFLGRRDKKLNLAMESSHLLSPFVPSLIKTFPKSKFILTIRDCYTWLNSIINDQINTESRRLRVYWNKAYDFYFFNEKYKFLPQEAILQSHELYPISAYLHCWKNYNEAIIDSVPKDRLLIVKTQDISQSLEKIFDFLEIDSYPDQEIVPHSYTCKKEHHLLSYLDSDYLENKVKNEAGELMKKYFPSADLSNLLK